MKVLLPIMLFFLLRAGFGQKEMGVEVQSAAFQTKEFEDIVFRHVADFEKKYQTNPTTVVIRLYEKKLDRNENLTTTGIEIDVMAAYCDSPEMIPLLGPYECGFVQRGITILVIGAENKSFKQLFAIHKEKKRIPIRSGEIGNSIQFKYEFKNYQFKFIDSFDFSDLSEE